MKNNGNRLENEGQVHSRYIDYLGVFAAFGIVMLHSHGEFYTYEPSLRWMECAFFEIFFEFSVPCFFMMTGANLMDYREKYDTRTYVRKRVRKTVIPFFFWSIVGILFSVLLGQTAAEDVTPLNFVSWILNCNKNNSYWFFLPLFAIYITIPILSLVPQEHHKTLFSYLITASFLLMFFVPFLCQITGVVWNSDLSAGAFGGYVLFPVLGYYIHKYNVPRALRTSLYIAGAASFVFCLGATMILSMKDHTLYFQLLGNFSPFILLYSAAVFTWFRNHDFRSQNLHKVVSFFRSTTFGVYLLHVFALEAIAHLGIMYLGFDKYSVTFRMWGGLISFFGCVILTRILQKIPYVRALVS